MRSVIITGGAGGMGLATARIMAADHRVVLADVNQERLDAAVAELAGSGAEVLGVRTDITDRASVQALFAAAADGGRLRAVVHTAGLSPLMGTPEAIIRVNALGTVHITEASLRAAEEGYAHVNVASIAGHMTPGFLLPRRSYKLARRDPAAFTARLVAAANRGPERMRAGSAYSISKSFVIWYSQKMAAPFGARGARILSVSPGSFDTEMGRLEKRSGSDRLLNFAALKRFGRPEEIAALLAFVAGSAPGYLTGTDILVDGGTRAGLDLKGMLSMARGK